MIQEISSLAKSLDLCIENLLRLFMEIGIGVVIVVLQLLILQIFTVEGWSLLEFPKDFLVDFGRFEAAATSVDHKVRHIHRLSNIGPIIIVNIRWKFLFWYVERWDSLSVHPGILGELWPVLILVNFLDLLKAIRPGNVFVPFWKLG